MNKFLKSDSLSETEFLILRKIDKTPVMSQRELARSTGISLGKINYCLKALIEKGLIKANNFRNSRNKLAYAYVLTPKGLEQKAVTTAAFIKKKMLEYDELNHELELLQGDDFNAN